jgi:hypothetical protein
MDRAYSGSIGILHVDVPRHSVITAARGARVRDRGVPVTPGVVKNFLFLN